MSEATEAATLEKSVTPKRAVMSRRAVTVRAPSVPAEPLSFDQQLLRIAGDPKIPVARLQEIADLRRKIRLEDAEEAFNIALVAAQQEMRPVEANANNPQTRSDYATLYAVDKALRPIYSRHGFSLSFNTADCPLSDHVRVLCYVSRGLFTRTYQHDVAVTTVGPQGKAVMTPTHAEGSAVSYGKRYLELMIFHVTIGDPGRSEPDDDGNAAGFPGDAERLTPLEIELLRAELKKVGCAEANFLRAAKRERIEDIPAANYDRCLTLIKSYKGPRQ